METLPHLIRLCIDAAQDGVGILSMEEEDALERVSFILEEYSIDSVKDLVEALK